MATNGKADTEATESKKTCFVVCPIGGELSPQRKHSDQALRHIIAPVLEAAGFEKPDRADKLSESGSITRHIITHIREDSLVIADLTGHNPNVFYELAIRHCTGLPFIQMIRKGETIPFDLVPMRTIFFDLTDPDDIVTAKDELGRQVEAAMAAGAQVDTPVGQAMDFEKLRSGTGTDQLLSVLIEQIGKLSRRIPFVPPDDSGKAAIRYSMKRAAAKLEVSMTNDDMAVLTEATWQHLLSLHAAGKPPDGEAVTAFIEARLRRMNLPWNPDLDSDDPVPK